MLDSIYNFIGFIVFWIAVIAVGIVLIDKFITRKEPSLVWIKGEDGKTYWVPKKFFMFTNSCSEFKLKTALKNNQKDFFEFNDKQDGNWARQFNKADSCSC